MIENPEHRLVQILRHHGIDHVATLPCDKIKGFLSLIPQSFCEIPLTREADGLGLCAGLALAGKRPAMVIQNTGLGNLITDVASLFQVYQIPLPLFVSWRGVYKEPIDVQKNLGEKTPRLLDSIDIPYTIVETPDQLHLVSSAIENAYRQQTLHAILLSPRIWETSSFLPNMEEVRHGRHENQHPTGFSLSYKREPTIAKLSRYDAIKTIMDTVDEQITVSNIGAPSKETFAISDRPLNFYMLGSLGLATSIGIGLSMGQEREVWVLDGDGAILMNPNALFSLSMFGKQNITVFAIDNASWGSTGNQITPTLDYFDLELLARSCGIKNTFKVHSTSQLQEALNVKGHGPRFIHYITKPGNKESPTIPLSPLEIKGRFLSALSDGTASN